jgi:hypothetical protein
MPRDRQVELELIAVKNNTITGCCDLRDLRVFLLEDTVLKSVRSQYELMIIHIIICRNDLWNNLRSTPYL